MKTISKPSKRSTKDLSGFLRHSLPPFFFAILMTCVLQLTLGKRVPIEVLSGLAILVVWLAGRRLNWDRNVILCLVSAVVFSSSAPGPGLSFLAFVAFAPFLLAPETASSLAYAAYYGVVFGVMMALNIFSWGSNSFAHFCETGPIVSLLLFLPASLFLVLKFPALAVLHKINRDRLKLPELLFLPVCFTALETLTLEFYPWYVSFSQVANPRLTQVIDLIGTPGLSGFIMLVNVALLGIWRDLQSPARKIQWRPLVITGSVFLLIFSYGELRLRQIHLAESEAKVLKVASIQPNTDAIIHNTDREAKRKLCDTLYALAKESVQSVSPDLIVFAESSAPMAYQFGGNPEFRDLYNGIAKDFDAYVLTDNIHYVDKEIFYRGALLLNPEAKIEGEYLKRILVPFGERIPFRGLFPFLDRLFPYVKRYHAGRDLPVLRVKGVVIVPQICFEIIHPGSVREYVARGGDLLINMSNDAWYADRKETIQHFASARFRCVENRVPMVRVTKSGISGYVSSTGEIAGAVSPMNQTWAECRPVPVPRLYSFYRRYGDVFGWSSVLLLALMIGYPYRTRFFRMIATKRP